MIQRHVECEFERPDGPGCLRQQQSSLKRRNDRHRKVMSTGQSPKSAETARAAMPSVEVIVSDQSDPAAARSLVDQVKDKHGRIDVLFVNAGIGHFAPLNVVDEAFFDRQFAINVRGLYFVTKHAAPAIPDGGAIIFTGSTAASSGGPNMSVYSATKAAVRSFSRTLAAELAPRNIRVNTLSPGPVETPIFGKTGLSQDQIDGFIAEMRERVPLKRISKPDEIARAALFLAADATYVTGTELIAGGGLVDVR